MCLQKKIPLLPMMFRMLSAISVGVTVPCFVSVCNISSIDSSLFRVLFWHSSQINSRLTAWKNTQMQVVHTALFICLIVSFVFYCTYCALCESSRGLLYVTNSGQVQRCQGSRDVTANSYSVITLIPGISCRFPGLLILIQIHRHSHNSGILHSMLMHD